MPKGTTISHREVIEYFKAVSPDMRELVLDLVAREVAAKDEQREVLGKRLAKARAAKGKGGRKKSADASQNQPGVVEIPEVHADASQQAQIAAELPAHTPRRGRPSHQPQQEQAQAAVAAE